MPVHQACLARLGSHFRRGRLSDRWTSIGRLTDVCRSILSSAIVDANFFNEEGLGGAASPLTLGGQLGRSPEQIWLRGARIHMYEFTYANLRALVDKAIQHPWMVDASSSGLSGYTHVQS